MSGMYRDTSTTTEGIGTMNIKIHSMIIGLSLMLLSGCVAYAPYPEYSAAPYGGYGYAAPVVPVPVPMFYGGWRHDGFRHHRHH